MIHSYTKHPADTDHENIERFLKQFLLYAEKSKSKDLIVINANFDTIMRIINVKYTLLGYEKTMNIKYEILCNYIVYEKI